MTRTITIKKHWASLPRPPTLPSTSSRSNLTQKWPGRGFMVANPIDDDWGYQHFRKPPAISG